MFILSERLVTLGEAYSGKKSESFTFELLMIPIDETEVNAFYGHPNAYNRLHRPSLTGPDENGVVKLEPFLPGLKSLEMKKPLEGAYIELRYGLSMDRKLLFKDVKLSSIKMTLGDDGETYLSAKCTAPPVLDDTLTELIGQFGQGIMCTLRSYPPEAQSSMPLNSYGEGEGEPQPRARRSRRSAH